MYAEVAEIYQYAQLIPGMKEIIKNCYAEEDFHVRNNWKEMQELVVGFCRQVAKTDASLANQIYDGIAQACGYTTIDESNYILMGDGLNEVMPLMYRGMATLGAVAVSDEQWEFISSQSGFLTLKNAETKKIYHSTVDPMWESYELAKRIYDSKFTAFCFLGCGLGYLPWQVFCASDCSVDIYIFHNDAKLVRHASDFGVLDWIPENKLHIILEEDLDKLFQRILGAEEKLGRCGYHCLEDVLEQYRKGENGQKAAEFVSQQHMRTLWGNSLTINAYRNAYHVPNMIMDFKRFVRNDEWIAVAAGPSLDDCMEYIRVNVGKKTIVCASTVLKKLLKNGIKPDAVAVLDPQARTWGHFEGLEDMSVPLLLNVTANWRFGELYTGPKYIIPSLTDETTIRNYMLQGVECWDLGSTVSSMMLQIAVRFGAKTVEMIGMDLAYPTGRTHASGTMDEKEIRTDGMIMVPSMNGEMVPTTPQFMIYIQEIEKIIKDNRGISFINRSRQGALYSGVVKP